MRIGLRGRMLIASSLLAGLVAVAFAILIFALRNQEEAASQALDSQQVIATANRLEKLVLDVESGHRGYLVTSQDRFLESYDQARAELPGALTQLEVLVADNPAQEARSREITAAVRTYLDEFAVPLVELARDDVASARVRAGRGEGKRRVDAIRGRFARFVAEESRLGDARDAHTEATATRAIVIAGLGIAASTLLIVLFAAYLGTSVVRPTRRLAAASRRLASGDLSTRVRTNAPAELGELGRSFNAMADALGDTRDELERQNDELELQTTELEGQRADLEQALDELADEKRRVDAFYRFAEDLASETEVERCAAVALGAIADYASAEIGALFLAGELDEYELAAGRGVAMGETPARVVAGEGLAGRALLERRSIHASYPDTTLRLSSFGESATVRRELHVPLLQGERVLGVVSLGRAGGDFVSAERTAIEHLADQASAALSSVLAMRRAIALSQTNRAVLDATRDGIRLVDVEGRTLLANPAIEALTTEVFGFDRESTLGERSAIADRLRDPAAYLRTMERIAADPTTETVDEFELADSGRSFERFTAPVRDDRGALLGRIIVVRETTAERAAQKLKTDLVATVSHELRTPLASVLGFAQLLTLHDVDPQTRTGYLETIYREATRLTNLINDFLDLQRIERGHFVLAREPFELGEVLVAEAEVFRGHSDRHRIVVDVPALPLVVLGEPDRMAQVVANLLSNAIKYTPAGGPVTVEARRSGDGIRVSVTDTGLGIDEDQRDRLFQPFYRVDSPEAREIGGTGLGLSLVREIVAAHGGTIDFTSAKGRGSTFWFELPAADAAPARSGPGRILVVGDDPAAGAILAEQLGSGGYAIELATTGGHAVAAARRDPPSLICFDLALGGGRKGWDTLVELKTSAATAFVPLVVGAAGRDRSTAACLDVSDFAVEPLSRRRVGWAVARLLPVGGRVLLADGSDGRRAVVREAIAAVGRPVEITELTDGEAVLDAVADGAPADLIVLDLLLPLLDGLDVLERLRREGEASPTPVLVLAPRELPDRLRQRALRQLAAGTRSPEELRRLVRRSLAGAQARRRGSAAPDAA